MNVGKYVLIDLRLRARTNFAFNGHKSKMAAKSTRDIAKPHNFVSICLRDMKLVSRSRFSGSRNPTLAIYLHLDEHKCQF